MLLENHKQIEAPQSIIWKVTENIEAWPQWTPTVENIKRLDKGPFDVGSAALIKQPGLPEVEWRVTALTKGESFTWEASLLGIRTIARHELIALGDKTKSILHIKMSGFVVLLLWPLLRFSIPKALEVENSGLKAKSEAMVKKH